MHLIVCFIAGCCRKFDPGASRNDPDMCEVPGLVLLVKMENQEGEAVKWEKLTSHGIKVVLNDDTGVLGICCIAVAIGG